MLTALFSRVFLWYHRTVNRVSVYLLTLRWRLVTLQQWLRWQHNTEETRMLRLQYANRLALARYGCFVLNPQAQDADAAIRSGREALSLCPDPHPYRQTLHGSLSQYHYTRYALLHESDDMEQAIFHHRHALQLQPAPGHIQYVLSTLNLANALSIQFELHSRSPEALEEAITLMRQLCASIISSDIPPEIRQKSLFFMAQLHLRLWSVVGTDDIYDQATLHINDILPSFTAPDPQRYQLLQYLGLLKISRFLKTGNADDLNRTIDIYHEILDIHAPGLGDPARTSLLEQLTTSLLLRYHVFGDPNDLDTCAAYCQDVGAGSSSAMTSPASFVLIRNRALVDRARFLISKERIYLDTNIDFLHNTLPLLDPSHPDRSSILSTLAMYHWDRFMLGDEISDVEMCIRLYQEAIACYSTPTTPASLPSLGIPTLLSSISQALLVRFIRFRQTQDLTEAVLNADRALKEFSSDYPERTLVLNNRALVLTNQFDFTGELPYLDEAIAHYREIIAHDVNVAKSPRLPLIYSNLAQALHIRFTITGNIADLEETVELSRSAYKMCQPSHADFGFLLMNLQTCLVSRFHRVVRFEDMEEAIELGNFALETMAPNEVGRATILENLAMCLSERHTVASGQTSLADIEQSISYYRESISLRNPKDPRLPVARGNLSLTLCAYFERTDKRELLDESMERAREVLVTLPEDRNTPYRLASLHHMANLVYFSYLQSNDIAGLRECISYARQTIAMARHFPNHPMHCNFAIMLVTALEALHIRNPDLTIVQEIVSLLRDAATANSSGWGERLQVAARWAQRARSIDDESTLSAYRTCLELSELTLITAPTLPMQHELVRWQGTLSLDAASYAVQCGSYHLAVEFLEHGRALLWSQIRRLRTPMGRLATINEALQKEFADTCSALEALNKAPNPFKPSVTSPARTFSVEGGVRNANVENIHEDDIYGYMLKHKRRLTEHFEQLVGRIRALPGFGDFLALPSNRELQLASAEGPVIIVNHNKHSSYALIIVEHTELACIHLAGTFYDDIIELASKLISSRREMSTRLNAYSRELSDTMLDLWESLVRPVVMRLLEMGVKPGSRIWWCTTSVLSDLPIHAAGPVQEGDDELRKQLSSAGFIMPKKKKEKLYLPDLFVSSYTPTLAALIDARRDIPHSKVETSLLAVAQTEGSLAAVGREIDVIKSRVANTRTMEVLTNDQCTRDRVISALGRHPWAHFGCHGVLQPGEPFQSSLILHGPERLTLLDIVDARLPNNELAFLSACHTAEQTENSASEEALHLAAAMQFAGFRSVVGTMWPLKDEDGPSVARDFYAEMFDTEHGEEIGFKRAARSLNSATRKLRMKKGEDGKRVSTERWVNFIHIGA